MDSEMCINDVVVKMQVFTYRSFLVACGVRPCYATIHHSSISAVYRYAYAIQLDEKTST